MTQKRDHWTIGADRLAAMTPEARQAELAKMAEEERSAFVAMLTERGIN